jgi:ABC-type molybdenum transport system ATPase subunit/photorepair protein PhrA
MADNKRKRGKADRARVSASEPFEVAYFARKHGMTKAAVKKLIKRVGNSRKKLEAALKKHAKADRARVSANQPSEVAYFARTHGMTAAAVKKLIKRVGNSRKKLDAAAKKMGKGKRKVRRKKRR